MAKRSSLFAPEPAPPTKAADPVAVPSIPDSTRKHVLARTREGKRNATAYLEPEAFQQLKLIAVREDTTVQALLLEGINEVFAKRNLSRIA